MFNKSLLTKAIICAILIIVAGAIFKSCDKKRVKEITSEQLRPGESTAVIINGNTVSIVESKDEASTGKGIRNSILRGRKPQPSGTNQQTVERIDGARGIRISVSPSGNVSINARTKGFILEPGMGIYSTTEYRRIFVDTQFLFYRRHGLNAGLGLGLRGKLEPTAFLAYSYNFWSSTSIIAGYDTKQEVLVGVRVRF